jgi:glutamyl-tRNA reductase
VFEEMTQGLGRDANATSRRRRMVAAHGEAVAGLWRVTAGLDSV